MKKHMPILLAAAIMFCSLFTTGCSPTSSPEERINITLITAQQANQPAPSLSLIQDDLFQVARSFGTAQLIRLDGRPALSDTLTVPEKEGLYSKKQLDNIATSQASKMEATAAQIVAEEPESDLLSALRLAGQCAERVDGQKNILTIFSNGISTVAPLDMSTTVLHNLDSDTIVQELEKQNEIPNLSAYDEMRFYQLGETELPQEPLTENDKAALKDLWQKILQASGYKGKITFDDTPSLESQKVDGLPSIKTVTVVESENAIHKDTKDSGINVALSQQSVAFAPDTAELADPSAAQAALRPTADTLIANPSLRIVIVGQTATVGAADACRELSKQRAESVAAQLEAMGVPGSQIRTIGCGCDANNPLHVKDTDENGNIEEKLAEKNRIVSILDASTPLAQEILEKNN